jgi:hypothetical protein
VYAAVITDSSDVACYRTAADTAACAAAPTAAAAAAAPTAAAGVFWITFLLLHGTVTAAAGRVGISSSGSLLLLRRILHQLLPLLPLPQPHFIFVTHNNI